MNKFSNVVTTDGQETLILTDPEELFDLNASSEIHMAAEFPAYKKKLATRELPNFLIKVLALLISSLKTST